MSLPFSLVSTFLLFYSSSTFFSFSFGTPHFPLSQTSPPTAVVGWRDGDKLFGGREVSWGNFTRLDVEGPISEPVEQYSFMVLAAQTTHRKDPLDGFKRYSGGWNIRDRHYWASVGFTAAPLFAIAAAWFLLFGACLLIISLCYFCCERQPYGYSQMAYALSLISLILFTIASIFGCVVLYTGQKRFHYSTSRTLEYVVNQADSTVEKLRTVSDYLATAKQTGVDQVFLPSDVQTDIDRIETELNSSASTIADKTLESSDDIKDLLDSVRLSLIIIAAVVLLLTFLGFLFSIFGMQLLVYILVITGWIIVTGTFILSGTFLMLHNVTADTCVAMDEWVQNPTAHTALDELLPCVNKATAQETLVRSKEVTFQFVDLINSVITNVSNINFSPNFKSMYFNQSGPLVPILCNPFHPDLSNRACSAGEVDLQNATQVWGNYVCQVSASDICTTTGRLTPTLYNQMVSGLNVSNALYKSGPSLVELQDCTFARETFASIYRDHCPGLLRYSRWIYVGLAVVSTAVMLSLILWVVYGRERRHRLYSKEKMGRTEADFEGNKESQP